MSGVTRRTFMGMVAGSAAVAALPRRVLGMAVEPAGDVFELANTPASGGIVYLARNGVYLLPEVGMMQRLSRSIEIIDDYYRFVA